MKGQNIKEVMEFVESEKICQFLVYDNPKEVIAQIKEIYPVLEILQYNRLTIIQNTNTQSETEQTEVQRKLFEFGVFLH